MLHTTMFLPTFNISFSGILLSDTNTRDSPPPFLVVTVIYEELLCCHCYCCSRCCYKAFFVLLLCSWWHGDVIPPLFSLFLTFQITQIHPIICRSWSVSAFRVEQSSASLNRHPTSLNCIINTFTTTVAPHNSPSIPQPDHPLVVPWRPRPTCTLIPQ